MTPGRATQHIAKAITGPPWFRFASWLLDYPFRGSLGGVILVSIYLFSNVAAFFQIGGVTGSPGALAVVVVACTTVVVTLALILHALRWWLVYTAVKSFVRNRLWGTHITQDTVLVGGSGGGGIAVGMVAKAIQELRGQAPRVAVIDQDYLSNQYEPATATLVLFREELRGEHVLYVTSYVGTGRSRRAMLTNLGIASCATFAFVVDEAARDVVEFYLVTGKRHIIPWPR